MVALALALAVFAVFCRVLQGDFVLWDDDLNAYDTPHIQGLTPANVRWMFTNLDYARRYMPLGWLLCGSLYQLGRSNPAAFHAASLLFHCANTVLLFLALKTLLAKASGQSRSLAEFEPLEIFGAAAGALLWAVNPLRVESVAWASGLIYLQAVFLLLVCLWCHLKRLEARGAWRHGLYAASLVALAASLLTYPIGLAFVGVLVLMDFIPLRRLPWSFRGLWSRDTRPVWVEKLPFLLIASAVSGLTLAARLQARGQWAPPPSLEEFGPGTRLMQAFYVWAHYVWKPLLPFRLSPLHTTLVDFNPNGPVFRASAVFVVGLSALLVWPAPGVGPPHWRSGLATWGCSSRFLVSPSIPIFHRTATATSPAWSGPWRFQPWCGRRRAARGGECPRRWLVPRWATSWKGRATSKGR